jgi:spore cortex formation protein SpoVR/YcgB (stage V sporulation)
LLGLQILSSIGIKHVEAFNDSLLGLQILSSIGIKHVEAFNDSLLAIQHVVDAYQCFDGSLNTYLDKCMEIIALLRILLCNMFLETKIQWQMI